MPDGRMAVIINLRQDELRAYDPQNPRRWSRTAGTVVVGPRGTGEVIDTACQAEIMGVHFRPGGLRALLGLPAAELAECQVDLAHVWDEDGGALRDRLVAATTVRARFQIMEVTLRRRLAPTQAEAADAVVSFAVGELESGRARRVEDVMARTGYSARHFNRLFTDAVGLAPKVYHRVQRFRRVLRELHGPRPRELVDLAMDAGYYDQAHFTHDFRRLAGCTPAEYLRRRPDNPYHLPIPRDDDDGAGCGT